jgi:putative transposase
MPERWSGPIRALVGRATAVTLENVALRHQLAILQRAALRPRIRRRDRIFWVCLSRLWGNWRASLLIIQPATVLAWHRQGFQLYCGAPRSILSFAR